MPAPSAELAARFGAALPTASRYAEILATTGMERGLLGPRELPRLWERHLGNCALLAPLLPPDATVCDVGSGSGLPGIVLGLCRPDVTVTLLEPLLRRATFLTETLAELDLPNVSVIRGRAEEFSQRRFAVVTARAVAPLTSLVPWTAHLLAAQGTLLAMKGASAAAEVEAAQEVLRRLKPRSVSVEPLRAPACEPSSEEETYVVRVEVGVAPARQRLPKGARTAAPRSSGSAS